MAEVIDRDLGWKRICQKVMFLDGRQVKAGVLETAGNEKNGVPIVKVAKWNEYGTPSTSRRPWSVPARPFMAITFDEKRGWKTTVEGEIMTNIVSPKGGVTAMLGAIGKQMKTDIKNNIGVVGKYKPLAPSTVARKGHNIPLMDSGALYDAIDYEVK